MSLKHELTIIAMVGNKLLDAVEEIIRNNEEESSQALKSKNLEVSKP